MRTAFSLSRRCVFAAILAALSTLALAAIAAAEAPMQKSQAPGYFRMMLGQFEITALCDGVVQLDAALLQNISAADIQKLLAREFIDSPHKLPASVNAYLVNTGAKLVLIDAGSGSAMGATLGRLVEDLKASGYKPEQVDAALITHLHPDHVAGLLNAQSKPVFPNAVVYVRKAENNYWLSAAEPENVPAAYQEHLKQARQLVRSVARPYLALNQWKTFDDADLPIAGIKAVPIPGHTPGHTAYEIQSAGKSLLILGDMIHCAAVQFARPDAAVSFDSDPQQAIATRAAVFRRVAENKTLVAGMHLPFPGIGRLRIEGKNAYSWAPVDYAPIPAAQSSGKPAE
jgi:glyoxylase-like metal-dependent hydrolase (beta-lactamase superfamily II)